MAAFLLSPLSKGYRQVTYPCVICFHAVIPGMSRINAITICLDTEPTGLSLEGMGIASIERWLVSEIIDVDY